MHFTTLLSIEPLGFQGENAQVMRLHTEVGPCIRKSGGTPCEGDVVAALARYQPFVPAFLGQDDAGLYFSELPGRNLAQAFADSPELRLPLARALGYAVRQIHTWEPPLQKPENDWHEEALARVRATARKYANERIDQAYSPFSGTSYLSLATWVEAQYAQTPSQRAFCHGDTCLPNFLTDGTSITGAVDWGEAGWADPRFDLATTLWSLRRNSPGDPATTQYIAAFLKGYGWEGNEESLALFEAIYTLWE